MTGAFEDAALVHGLVPTCGHAELQTRSGAVLDRMPVVLAHNRPPRQRPTLRFPGVLQVPAGRPSRTGTVIGGIGLDLVDVLYDTALRITHGSGITVTPRRTPLVDLSDADVGVTVTPTPGLHPVTATLRGGNVRTARQVFTVYAPGGAAPRPTDSLAGHAFSTQDQAVSFLDDRFAFVGVPPAGRPTCTSADVDPDALTGCLPYAWNATSNLLRIGQWIGAVDFAPGNHALRGAHWYSSTYCQDFTYPAAGQVLDGSYELRVTLDSFYDATIDDYEIVFGADGAFDLQVSKQYGETKQRFRGRYAVGPDGRLDLTVADGTGAGAGAGERTVTGTVAVHTDANGEPRPDRGLVLDLDALTPGAHGNFGGPGYPVDVLDRGPSAPAAWTPARFGADACVRPRS